MLSQSLQDRIHVAIANQDDADELIAAINADSPTPAAHVAPVSAANATDLASAETLANANKTAINAVIASLIASGAMSAS